MKQYLVEISESEQHIVEKLSYTYVCSNCHINNEFEKG